MTQPNMEDESLSKFLIGEMVKVVDQRELRYEDVGEVTYIKRAIDYPEHRFLYKVIFNDGDAFLFYEHKLELTTAQTFIITQRRKEPKL